MINRIRELRCAANLTQSELAHKIGLNQSAIGKYERGELEPNIETLKKMCAVFECSVDFIIGVSDDFGNITVYQETDNISSLNLDEQKIIDAIRKTAPLCPVEWVTMYADLPVYMQESIFAELKGMHLGYVVSKNKKNIKDI